MSLNLDANVGRPTENQGTYEFDRIQEHTIRSLASAMKFVGIFMVVLGVLYGAGGALAVLRGQIGAMIVAGLQAALYIVLGLYLTSAAASFQRIVETTGSDIPNLMGALEQLRRYFSLQRVLIILAIAILGAVLLLYLVSRG